jgi:DNA-binding transcriptional regulator/RsmH inhibitor MraZ
VSRLFVGSAICEIASNGIITLPEPFFGTVTARGTQDDLHVGLHDQLNCLIVFDHVVLNERIERCACDQVIGTLPDATEPLDRLRRSLGFAAPARVDGAGRLAIAAWLDERRGESRHLLLVGRGHSFEVWDLDYAINHGQRDLQQLANLHLDLLNTQNQQGASHEISLQDVGSRRGARFGDQSGFPVQPLRPLQPRHDPIDGVARR